ncbi:hypothetical protein N8J89_03780 [Crossiella sp. CA-258035]|uniref:hypothetical protein n=1 Tax=Crossiella sp. CA-258035 TaxID=2981138 RepID=UPI0024BC78FB|nr:hypothetical protein [Crossiella sp. CA-258035]WHT20204.1 hypothetical protein N8J89_03780 [Crossiella sp. CA-258035]
MILIETLEEAVHRYVTTPEHAGAVTCDADPLTLARFIAEYLADRGVDIGYADGERLALPGRPPVFPDIDRHRLPLVLLDRGDHVRVYCDGRDCVWTWHLYNNATEQDTGQAITSAIDHVRQRHIQGAGTKPRR